MTSQFFANVYLNGLDHFVKERLRKYVRYVDDFALFSDDYTLLEEIRLAMEEHLANLRLNSCLELVLLSVVWLYKH